jgi:hypothetical protein
VFHCYRHAGQGIGYTFFGVVMPSTGKLFAVAIAGYSAVVASLTFAVNYGITVPERQVSGQWPIACDEGWLHVGDKCLQAFQTPVTWEEAQKACQGDDPWGVDRLIQFYPYQLASIVTNDELDAAVYLLATGTWKVHGHKMWIGLNDRHQEGNFTWDDTAFPHSASTFWNRNEPDDGSRSKSQSIQYGNEDCVELNSNGFSDCYCGTKNGYLCSRPARGLST